MHTIMRDRRTMMCLAASALLGATGIPRQDVSAHPDEFAPAPIAFLGDPAPGVAACATSSSRALSITAAMFYSGARCVYVLRSDSDPSRHYVRPATDVTNEASSGHYQLRANANVSQPQPAERIDASAR
jgi:hypothetical protein